MFVDFMKIYELKKQTKKTFFDTLILISGMALILFQVIRAMIIKVLKDFIHEITK